jgi:hypothetical protein
VTSIRAIVEIDQAQCDRTWQRWEKKRDKRQQELLKKAEDQAEAEQERQQDANQDLQDHIQSIGVGIAAGAIIASTSGFMMIPWSLPTRDNWIKPLSIHPFIIVLTVSAFCSWGAWKLMKWRIESRRKRSLKTTSQKTALKSDESGIYKS